MAVKETTRTERRGLRLRPWQVVGLAAGLAVAGCSGTEGGADTEPTPTQMTSSLPTPYTTPAASPTPLGSPSETSTGTPLETTSPSPSERSSDKNVMFTFDVLGGNVQRVNVYQGPGKSQSDKVITGYYFAEQQMPARCKVLDGREIPSAPEDGERSVTTDDWVLLDVGTPQPQYATATYIRNQRLVLQQLAECDEIITNGN